MTPEMATLLILLAGNSYALIGAIVLVALLVVGLIVRRMRKD
jgi:FtsZ-interacting cell division protein ZipA